MLCFFGLYRLKGCILRLLTPAETELAMCLQSASSVAWFWACAMEVVTEENRAQNTSEFEGEQIPLAL